MTVDLENESNGMCDKKKKLSVEDDINSTFYMI